MRTCLPPIGHLHRSGPLDRPGRRALHPRDNTPAAMREVYSSPPTVSCRSWAVISSSQVRPVSAFQTACRVTSQWSSMKKPRVGAVLSVSKGATPYQDLLNMIDWLPKMGVHGYFLQFLIPFTFFDRWYSHADNPYLAKEPLEREHVRAPCSECWRKKCKSAACCIPVHWN